MNWGLVDRTGESVSLSGDSDMPAARSILTRLPPECHDEFLLLLRDACADGLRRRLGITRTDRPLLVVDILPLHLKESPENPALVVFNDSPEFDSSYERLKKLARRNEAILRSSMDGFFVVDEHCRFLEVNEAFCAMTGYSADELLRMNIAELEVDEHANGGVPSHTRTGLHHFPTAHRHKDGHLVHLEISVNVLHDAGEKILVGFARDITERKHAEEALARLTREQKLILDSAAEGIAGLDPHGNITFINPAAARFFGANPGELIGRSAHDFLAPSAPPPPPSIPNPQSSIPNRQSPTPNPRLADCDTRDCPICAVLKNGRGSLAVDNEFVRTDGTRFPVECSITAMQTGPDVIGAVLVFKDITSQRRAEQERRSLEAQIQQSQKLESLGLLAGGIAHDLNNMLAGIQGNACLALAETTDQTPNGERGVGDQTSDRDCGVTDQSPKRERGVEDQPPNRQPAVQERLQRIVAVCERASKVIRQILAYAGHVTCDTSPLSLNDLVDDMAEFMRAAIPKSISLQTCPDPQLPIIQADSGQLQQVIATLLVNAVEAIGDATGRITLATESLHLDHPEINRRFPAQNLSPGQYACLHVEDTGRGMSPDTLQRIFEPFFSNKGPGRGLGLSAMRGVVRAHRGAVSVQSELEKGTRFSLLFPTPSTSTPQSPTANRQSSTPNPQSPTLNRQPSIVNPQSPLPLASTVLVIDDEFEVRDVIKDMLASRGLRVLTAEDGTRGIQLFKLHAHTIDLVLLDVAMPGTTGDDVLRQILAIRPDAKVILASGFIQESLPNRFSHPKPAAFLHKPFTTNTLINTINTVLQGQRNTCNTAR